MKTTALKKLININSRRWVFVIIGGGWSFKSFFSLPLEGNKNVSNERPHRIQRRNAYHPTQLQKYSQMHIDIVIIKCWCWFTLCPAEQLHTVSVNKPLCADPIWRKMQFQTSSRQLGYEDVNITRGGEVGVYNLCFRDLISLCTSETCLSSVHNIKLICNPSKSRCM